MSPRFVTCMCVRQIRFSFPRVSFAFGMTSSSELHRKLIALCGHKHIQPSRYKLMKLQSPTVCIGQYESLEMPLLV